MIIGKGGNFIKQIKEESGAYVQISQKSKETNLPERCVTVAGELMLFTLFILRLRNVRTKLFCFYLYENIYKVENTQT